MAPPDRHMSHSRWSILERALLNALREANRRCSSIENRRTYYRDEAVVALRTGNYDRYNTIIAEMEYATAVFNDAQRSWWESMSELQALMTTPIVADEVLEEESTEPLPPAGGAGRPGAAPAGSEGTARPSSRPDWQGYYGDT